MKSVVAQSRLSLYFELHVLALFLDFHRDYNLARNILDTLKRNEPISVRDVFNLQHRILLRAKLIARDEKRETSNLNLNSNNVARQVEGFLVASKAIFSIFRHRARARLSNKRIQKPRANGPVSAHVKNQVLLFEPLRAYDNVCVDGTRNSTNSSYQKGFKRKFFDRLQKKFLKFLLIVYL